MKRLFPMTMAAWVMLTTLAEPTVSNVRLRQCWPWSRNVIVTFTLSGAEEPQQVKLAFTSEGKTIDVPDTSVTGQKFDLVNGDYRLVWDPMQCGLANQGLIPDVELTVTPTVMPIYMIVDLSAEKGSPEQVTYISEAGIRSGAWGDWEESPDLKTVIWTGVTNSLAYKQEKLVLRYIPATTSSVWSDLKGKTTFTLGAPSSAASASSRKDNSENVVYDLGKSQPQGEVTLTKGCWMAVFETTQWQFQKLMGWTTNTYKNDDGTLPVETLEWRNIRGSNYDGAHWPQVGHEVCDYSCVYKLRVKTGLMFDLPTEAQWTFAARAGAEGFRYGELAEIAHCNATEGTAVVGSLKPNAWGLYDMLGNVREGVLAAFNGGYVNADFGTDPVGQSLGDPFRTVRGGGWDDGAACVNFHAREQCWWSSGYDPNNRRVGVGFRISLPIDL